MTKREKYYSPKIYALVCPIENRVRYIGATKRYLSERLARHCNPPKHYNLDKQRWISNLKAKGLKPKIRLIEVTSEGNLIDRERYWIAHYGRENLLNMNDGGNRPPDMAGWNKKKLSKEIIDKLGAMPDYKLAKIASVNKTTIARLRRKLGIESYAKRTGNNGQFTKKGG